MHLPAFEPASLRAAFQAALLVMFTVIGLNPSSAFAEHPRQITWEFSELEVHEIGDAIRVDYSVRHDAWRAARRAHIRPRLNLYARGHRGDQFEYLTSVELVERHGSVTFDHVGHHVGRRAQLRVSGHRGGIRIAQTRYADSCSDRITVSVHEHTPPPPRRRHHGRRDAHHAALIEACGDATDGSGVGACVSRASKLPAARAAQTVAACDAATSWSSELNACLDRAAKVASDPAGVVAACDAATSWSSELNTCIDRASRLPSEPAGVVAACDAASNWSSELNSCIDRAVKLPHDPAGVVAACDAATSWASEMNSCIDRAAKLPRNPAGIVAACDAATSWTSEMNACIDEAAQLRSHRHYAHR